MYRITNGNAFDFTAMFDGQEYFFPSGEPVYCGPDATAHIFGLGQQDKSAIMSRHGWATYSNTYQQGLAILNNFKFEHMTQVLDAPLALVGADSGPAPGVQDPADLGESDGSPKSGGIEASSGAAARKPTAPPGGSGRRAPA